MNRKTSKPPTPTIRVRGLRLPFKSKRRDPPTIGFGFVPNPTLIVAKSLGVPILVLFQGFQFESIRSLAFALLGEAMDRGSVGGI